MRLLPVLISAIAFSLLSPDLASAQPAAALGTKETARKLAEQGFDAMETGAFKKAYQLFRQADAEFHAPTLVFMQGEAAEKSGSLLDARAAYQRVVDEKLPPDAPKDFLQAQEDARAALQKLAARIPSLRITLTNVPASALLTIGGAALPSSKWNQWIDQDPGSHTIVVNVGGTDVAARSVTLREGAREEIKIDLPPTTTAPVVTAPVLPAPPPGPPPSPISPPSSTVPEEPSGKQSSSAPAIASLVGGGAFLGLGLAMGAFWKAKNDVILPQCSDNQCPQSLASEIDSAKTLGRVALVGVLVGGAGIGAGIILLATGGSSTATTTTAKTATTLTVGPASLAVTGTF